MNLGQKCQRTLWPFMASSPIHLYSTDIAQRAYGGALLFCMHFTYLQHCLSAPSLICTRVLSHACAMWAYICGAYMSSVRVTVLIRSQDQLTVCTPYNNFKSEPHNACWLAGSWELWSFESHKYWTVISLGKIEMYWGIYAKYLHK